MSATKVVKGGIRRHQRLALIAALALAPALINACGSSGSPGGTAASGGQVTLVYAGFGGDFGAAEESAWLKPYMKAHPNVKIVYDDTVDFAKMKAMVQTGNVSWDVFTGDLIVRDAKDYMEKINCSVVPCSQIVKANNVNPYVTVYYSYANVITYNKQAMAGKVPASWQDFFNVKKFPGKRALDEQAPYIDDYIAALLADGVPPDKIWPLDLKRAIAKLNSIKSDIIWYNSNQQCPQLVNSGEAAFGLCLNGRVYDAIKSGETNLGVSWNVPIVGYGAMSIPKGSKHVAAAMQLIGYITSAANNARLSNFIDYGPTNVNSFSRVSPSVASQLPSAHTKGKPYAQYDWNDFAKYGTKAVNTFQAFIQGG